MANKKTENQTIVQFSVLKLGAGNDTITLAELCEA